MIALWIVLGVLSGVGACILGSLALEAWRDYAYFEALILAPLAALAAYGCWHWAGLVVM